MKIKLDYVTNSSSCCYVIQTSKKITQYDINEKTDFRIEFNAFECLTTKEELITYTDCEPCDWVKKATGPIRFWGATKEDYEACKKIIDTGHFVLIAHVERNSDEVEAFDNIISGMEHCKVLNREYD